ncbi:tRNA1(Val) (adenine(37)-N6)-methyltransferase [Treponema sp.]|uniref:tRNA1(Val) (adenine(37)-N6)-methyltransferase n=1 Tax=Treponema sp. TaxID=166 RepID=UPI0025D9B040|nr:tRNA1(Val) (adenine(37)-N6)-methyltransferase [Treponema sp.]MCR5217612.1 tRNA1(Val) (adenine(37)-N6)-methyltransferase [Treponema sp.]
MNLKEQQITLNDNEEIDKLPDCDFSIIQNKKLFCYGSDALLLVKFCQEPANRIHDKDITVDLCTGNGIIPLLLASKCKSKIYGIELQEESFLLAERNIQLNKLDDQIKILKGDICSISSILPQNSASVVTVNPPYMKSGDTGVKENTSQALNIARHEIKCKLEDVIKAAAYLLNSSGVLFMIHRPERLSEIFAQLNTFHFEPKRLQFIYPSINKTPQMVLIEAKKNARSGLIIMPPYIMYP